VTVGAILTLGLGAFSDVNHVVTLGFGVASTPTPTPTPTPVASVSAGGYFSTQIQDKYWRTLEHRFEKKKKQALKKSAEAVDIVEEIAATQKSAVEALARLAVELDSANIREAAIYRDLLTLELEIKRRADDADDEDAILLALH
jgi:hypothetical protein